MKVVLRLAVIACLLWAAWSVVIVGARPQAPGAAAQAVFVVSMVACLAACVWACSGALSQRAVSSVSRRRIAEVGLAVSATVAILAIGHVIGSALGRAA